MRFAGDVALPICMQHEWVVLLLFFGLSVAVRFVVFGQVVDGKCSTGDALIGVPLVKVNLLGFYLVLLHQFLVPHRTYLGIAVL